MPSINGSGVQVKGLNDFRREVKKLADSGALINELKDVNFQVASLVVSKAQGHASTKMEIAAAATLKAGRQAARAVVTGGSAGVPFFGGAEFGAAQNQLRNTSRGAVTGWNQFKAWRGSGAGAGYFLYPAIRDETDKIVDMYGDAMEKIAGKAFPD